MIENPSKYQAAILSAVKTTSDSICTIGVPGCGKTTTSVAVMEAIRSGGIALAFNKAIQLYLEPRIPHNWSAKTFHALGYRACREHLTKEISKGKNNKDIVNCRRLPNRFSDQYSEAASAVSFAKRLGVGYCVDNIPQTWLSIIDGYGLLIPREYKAEICNLLPRIYTNIIEDTSSVTFDEMILFPLLYNLPTHLSANVVVDEEQDMAILEQLFVQEKVLLPKGRIIGFGDPRQSIYAFRGADHAAVDHFKDLFATKDLPLSISYRLPLSVAEHVRPTCPELETRDGAPDGSIVYHTEDLSPARFNPKGLIVCRNNAPLVALALAFLRDNIPCQLRTALREQLFGFIGSMKTDDISIFASRLEAWYNDEMQEAEDGPASRMEWLTDRYETFLILIEASSSVADMKAKISRIFSKTTGPIVSTVHKAKGLEAPDVYILRPDLMPSPRAKQDWEKQQEQNILFVAQTRTMTNLHYLPPKER